MQFTKYWFEDQRPVHQRFLRSTSEEIHILEIGAFEGMSTTFFMKYLDHPNSTLDTIDPFLTTDPTTPVVFDTYSRFVANVSQAPNFEKLSVHKCKSNEILPSLGMFDYILVDGSHLIRDVQYDAKHSLLHLKEDGIIFFDDYGSPMIRPFLDEFVTENNLKVLYKGWQLVVTRH